MRLFCGNFAEKVVKLPILKIFIVLCNSNVQNQTKYDKEKESEEGRGTCKEECR